MFLSAVQFSNALCGMYSRSSGSVTEVRAVQSLNAPAAIVTPFGITTEVIFVFPANAEPIITGFPLYVAGITISVAVPL